MTLTNIEKERLRYVLEEELAFNQLEKIAKKFESDENEKTTKSDTTTETESGYAGWTNRWKTKGKKIGKKLFGNKVEPKLGSDGLLRYPDGTLWSVFRNPKYIPKGWNPSDNSPCEHCNDEPCVFNKFYYYMKWYSGNFDFKRVDVSAKAKRRITYDVMVKILDVEQISDLPPCLIEGVRMMHPNRIGEPYSA